TERQGSRSDNRIHHDSSSLSGVASGISNRPATFLDFDDRLGVLQSPLDPCILPPGPRQFRRQRGQHRELGSPLGGRQRTRSSTVALPAPVSQGRRVQAFPAQDHSDPIPVVAPKRLDVWMHVDRSSCASEPSQSVLNWLSGPSNVIAATILLVWSKTGALRAFTEASCCPRTRANPRVRIFVNSFSTAARSWFTIPVLIISAVRSRCRKAANTRPVAESNNLSTDPTRTLTAIGRRHSSQRTIVGP